MGKLLKIINSVVEMRNFQDAFETRKLSFISAFSICMTVPLLIGIFNNQTWPNQTWQMLDRHTLSLPCW